MATRTINYLLKGGRRMVTVQGVASITRDDELIFDGSTYRDTLDSGFTGRDANSVAIGVDIADVGFEGAVAPNTTRPLVASSIGPPAFNIEQIPDPIIEESDEFQHIAPRPLEKKITFIRFWSEPAGAGDELACIPYDQFVTYFVGTIKML